MEYDSWDTIVELREELMVSPSTGTDSTLTTAYFLKPSIKEQPSDELLHPYSLFSKRVCSSSSSNPPPQVKYNGWLRPQKEWEKWVQQMEQKYEHVWIKAGIDQAINASKYQINRSNELILELAQRWCSETNTFIFPWGESTITLEDMKFCGGYSILGDPFSIPLETGEQYEAEAELIAIRSKLLKTKAKRAGHLPWMMHFMNNESKVEHEGFLSLWLSRFVFPANLDHTILKCVFPIAIHLARGTRIALAPPVLASIYRDLTLLNRSIMINDDIQITDASKLRATVIWAPFQLVQTWALERFPTLQPLRRYSLDQVRIARWHKEKIRRNHSLGLILDSAGNRDCFVWRPYENSPPFKLYNEKDKWECDNPCIGMELRSFGRCLWVSILVGFGCKEKYLPHRVAMQFGMDQDIPAIVEHCKEDLSICYSQPIMDTNMYKALCVCKPNPSVTSRYYNWWNQSKLGAGGDSDRNTCRREHLPPACLSPPVGLLTSNFTRNETGDPDQEGDKLAIIGGSVSSSSVGDETAGSMSTGGVCRVDLNNGVLIRGTESSREEGQTQLKEADMTGMKASFCDTNVVTNLEGKGTSSCDLDIASYLENRILDLERVFANLKAQKLRANKVNNISAKAKPL